MAQSSDLEGKMCLVWKTDKPFLDKIQTSSDFSLLGSEWNLRLTYYSPGKQANYQPYYNYKLSLHQGTETKDLPESLQFHVSALLEDRDKRLVLARYTKIQRTYEVLFDYTKSTICGSLTSFDNYGKMKIICFFDDFPPSAFQMKNERMHLSTQTDWGLPASVNVPPDLERMCLDFSNLLKNETLADVKLRCGDHIFFAHKCILAARCRVIADKLRKETVEREIDVIDVTGVDAGVLELLLKFLYTGKLPNMSEDIARRLYAAGDEYAVPGLKKACSDWMISGLTKEDCVRFLTTADEYNDDCFKDAIFSFIKRL